MATTYEDSRTTSNNIITNGAFDQEENPNHQSRSASLDGNKDGSVIHHDTVSSQEQLSCVKGADWPDTIPAIWDLFIDSGVQHPDALAIASVHQKGELYGLKNLALDHEAYQAQPYIRWTYGESMKLLTRLVGALQHAGAKPNFPVFTFLENCAEHALIFWAAATLGCVITPINPRNVLNKEEATHILNRAISTTSSSETVIFVQSDELAKRVLDLGILYQTHVIVIDTHGTHTNHRSFKDFVSLGHSTDPSSLLRYRELAKQWVLIIFTSGTTALPKGVVLDAYRLDLWMTRRRQTIPLVPGDSVLCSLPNNNAFYYYNLLTFLCAGGAMVLPSDSFSPQRFPGIIQMEQCTHLPMPPTMVHAVSQVAQAEAIKFKNLKNITIGGSKLSVELLRNCFEVLGSQGVELMYGATETGISVTTGIITDVDQIVRSGDAAVGWADMGTEIKICAPDETTPLPRNVEGELHSGGAVRIDGYAGEEVSDKFYTDENGQRWFVTGDAATINEEGMVFIVGRIKDMIIRGARNIAPAAIEFVLAREPLTKDFNVQIIGKLDRIAGDVPIAVSQRDTTANDVKNIQNTVLEHMGPVFLPEEVLTLRQLGLDDFPRTALGKIQKYRLRKIVQEYFDQRSALIVNDLSLVDEFTEKVQKVWKRVIGHTVKMDVNVSDFADSITTMRVRDRYAKDLGIKVTLAEILASRTVRDQMVLLRETSERSKPKGLVEHKDGVLTEADLVHLAGRVEWFPSTKTYITDSLSKLGLAWEDIQAITPASDFTHILSQADILNTSWSWKFALLAKAGIDKHQFRKGIEAMLAYNPLLSSFIFSDRAAFGSDISLHVVPRPSQKLLDAVFRDHGSISTKEEFAKLVYKPYEYEMALLPGVLIQFLMFDIEETGQSGTIMVAHHATTDASYLQLVLEDLDKALGGVTVLDEHISYKTWADSYYALRTSLEAQLAVNWHVDRLQDLSSHKASVFPALPRPHHYSRSQQYIQAVDDNGYHTDFHAKGITNLRQKHPILSAPTIIKAAWSLLNAYHNDTDTAVFSNLQADRRRFPFIPKALETISPSHTFEASNVAGQILQDVINIIPIHAEESLIDFLYRVTADQETLNTHAAAPLRPILDAIGPINSEIAIDILRSQIFNWTPGLGAMQTHNPYETFEPVATFIRPSLRLVINVDVGGHDDETVFAQIKSPLYDVDGLQGLARDFEGLVLWVCDEENWNTRLGGYKTALREMLEQEKKKDGSGGGVDGGGVQMNTAKRDHVI